MQEQAKYRVVWNEHKGSYEVQLIRPRIISWLAITPDSARWFYVLQQIPSFHFQGQRGHFTARKEKRARSGAYWIAYRHVQGKLIKRYIGTPTKVTIARLEEVADDLERQAKDAITFVSQKVASRPKWLTAFEYKRICELFCTFSRRIQAIEAHFEEVTKERLQARSEVVTEKTLAQEAKRVEIEETPLAMAIIAMMQERVLWQGTSDQLKKHFAPT